MFIKHWKILELPSLLAQLIKQTWPILGQFRKHIHGLLQYLPEIISSEGLKVKLSGYLASQHITIYPMFLIKTLSFANESYGIFKKKSDNWNFSFKVHRVAV